MTPVETSERDRPTVLITGATSGIGYQTAIGLAQQGARVLITGRDIDRGDKAVSAITHVAGHGRVEFHQADHSTVAGNRRLAARVDTALGERQPRLDVLINNVGRVFSARQETADGIEQTLALCLIGPVALTEALLPALRHSPRPCAPTYFFSSSTTSASITSPCVPPPDVCDPPP